jgi:hypothetical protein
MTLTVYLFILLRLIFNLILIITSKHNFGMVLVGGGAQHLK